MPGTRETAKGRSEWGHHEHREEATYYDERGDRTANYLEDYRHQHVVEDLPIVHNIGDMLDRNQDHHQSHYPEDEPDKWNE